MALLPISMGVQGGGILMEGYGQSQGLKAMAEEKRRQIAEWEAENAIQQAGIQRELDRKGASLAADHTAPALAARQQAVQGSGRLGANLGVGGARAAGVSSALVPQSVLAARGAGERTAAVHDRVGAGELNTTLRQSKLNQQDRARMYDTQLMQAGQKGHWWRQGGQLAQQLGYLLGQAGPMVNAGGPGSTSGGTLEGVDSPLRPRSDTVLV
jgi:hypothetical protein